MIQVVYNRNNSFLRLMAVFMIIVIIFVLFAQVKTHAIAITAASALLVAGMVAIMGMLGITFASSEAAQATATGFLEEFDYAEAAIQTAWTFNEATGRYSLQFTSATINSLSQLCSDVYDYCISYDGIAYHASENYVSTYNTSTGSYDITFTNPEIYTLSDCNGNSIVPTMILDNSTFVTNYLCTDFTMGDLLETGDTFYISDSFNITIETTESMSGFSYSARWNGQNYRNNNYPCNHAIWDFTTAYYTFAFFTENGINYIIPSIIGLTSSGIYKLVRLNYMFNLDLVNDSLSIDGGTQTLSDAYSPPADGVTPIPEIIEAIDTLVPTAPIDIVLPADVPTVLPPYSGVLPEDVIDPALNPLEPIIESPPALPAEITEALESTENPEPSPSPSPNPDGEETGDLDFTPLLAPLEGLENVFPFCIPFDIKDAVSNFTSTGSAPSWTFTFGTSINSPTPVEIDLAPFDDVAEVFRGIMLIIFIIGLAFLTSKVIKW